MSLNARRAWAAVVDHGIIGVLAAICMELCKTGIGSFNEIFYRTYVVGILVTVLYLGKDLVFKNASLGKRIFGLRVVSSEDGSTPGIGRMILRNLPPIQIAFVEAVLVWVVRLTRSSLPQNAP